MQKRVKVDPMEYPLRDGESWWMIQPNDGELELKVPVGAAPVCVEEFLDFGKGTAYRVVAVDDDQGWVSVEGHGTVFEMPRYNFARYFDAVPFIKGGHIRGAIPEEAMEVCRKKTEYLFEDVCPEPVPLRTETDCKDE